MKIPEQLAKERAKIMAQTCPYIMVDAIPPQVLSAPFRISRNQKGQFFHECQIMCTLSRGLIRTQSCVPKTFCDGCLLLVQTVFAFAKAFRDGNVKRTEITSANRAQYRLPLGPVRPMHSCSSFPSGRMHVGWAHVVDAGCGRRILLEYKTRLQARHTLIQSCGQKTLPGMAPQAKGLPRFGEVSG